MKLLGIASVFFLSYFANSQALYESLGNCYYTSDLIFQETDFFHGQRLFKTSLTNSTLLDSSIILGDDSSYIKSTYTFNQVGDTLLRTNYKKLHRDSIWIGIGRREYSWNHNRQFTKLQFFAPDYNQWYPTAWNDYTYDDRGNRIAMTVYTLERALYFHVDYSYDLKNNRIETVLTYWNDTTKKWREPIFSKFEYDYIGNTIANKTISKMDTLTKAYVFELKEEYEYYPTGLVKSVTRKDWDTTTLSWHRNYIDEYQYNANGKIIKHSRARLPISQWSGVTVYEYTYDSHGNMLTEVKYYVFQNGEQGTPIYTTTYYYPLKTTSAIESFTQTPQNTNHIPITTFKKGLAIYPGKNRAPHLVELTDLKGRRVKKKFVKGAFLLSITNTSNRRE